MFYLFVRFSHENVQNLKTKKAVLLELKWIMRILVNKSNFFFFFKFLQSGCCKPPTYCGFEFQNATYWVMPKKGPAVSDSDCETWSNDQKELCYSCKSCKAGLLANIKTQWRTLAIVNACIFVVLVFIYSVGCCAFRNNRRDKYKYRRGLP